MPSSLQNCDHQYRSSFKFALRIFCASFLYMSMALSLSAENAPQHRRIIAYECMNPKCEQSFTNMHSYDVHRYHARNVGTLCASLTMRREIIATRRAGLTTAVITRIPSKGKHCAWCIFIMTAAVLRPLFIDGRKFDCRKFELEFVHIGSFNFRMQLRCCKPSQRKFQLPHATKLQQTVV